ALVELTAPPGDELGEAGDVAKPQVEAHARDRMQRLCGIADHDAAARTRALRTAQGQGIRAPASDLQEPTQPPAEARLHFREELLVGPAERRLGRRRAQRQDERAAAVG